MADTKLSETQQLLELAALDVPRGLRVNEASATPGYVLFTPMISDTSYLVNRHGEVVHRWQSSYAPGVEYLVENGELLRSARLPGAPRFSGGGQAGRIERLSFDSEVLWAYELATEEHLLHHDFERLPNGNLLAIAWEHRTPEEAQAAGRDPERIPKSGLWPDVIFEIEPTASGGNIVWTWRSWDHLVQHQDASLPNYGDPREHPQRIDVNADAVRTAMSTEELATLQARNEMPTITTVDDLGADLHHSNAIAYNAELDQIALSVRTFNEIWIIDHAPDSNAARGAAGDLLYRWGNPSSYGFESPAGIGLGGQHDIRWIPQGYPGAGNLTAFSNSVPGADPAHSEFVEFQPPLRPTGRYERAAGEPFGPRQPVRTLANGMHSPFISGAQRLANGHTLLNFGPQGRFVEFDDAGRIVWEYWSPFSGEVRLPDGSHPQPGAPFMYAAFRASFVPEGHAALAGRALEPLQPQPAPSQLREYELAPFRL